MNSYFFDSYALFEVIFGNQQYMQLLKNAGMVTMQWNLLELHYHITVRRSKEDADLAYDGFAFTAVQPTDDDMKEASEFRAKNKNLKLSFIDCVGYIVAKRRGLKFLTGDKAFKGMDNVEYVV